MRLRHIPGSEQSLRQDQHYIIQQLSRLANLPLLFNNPNAEFCIEIGSGKCGFIIQNAIQNPSINYIGVEKSASPLLLGLKKIYKLAGADLPNLKLLWLDGNGLVNLLPSHSLAKIYLNFSDPWPKRRCTHRRLTHPNFLQIYQILLARGGSLYLKTDNQDLFTYSLFTLTQNSWTINNQTRDLYQSQYVAHNIASEYETKFHSWGIPICWLIASPPHKTQNK